MMIIIKIQLGRELMWLVLAQVPHPNAYLNPRMYLSTQALLPITS